MVRGCSLTVPRAFRARKASSQTATFMFLKIDLLTYMFNVRKTKRIAKFDGLESRRCKDIKGILAAEIGPKSLGTFEKQAPRQNLNPENPHVSPEAFTLWITHPPGYLHKVLPTTSTYIFGDLFPFACVHLPITHLVLETFEVFLPTPFTEQGNDNT